MIKATDEQRAAGLAKAAAIRAERVAAGLSATLNPMERFDKNPTPMNAIRAQCYDCMGQAESYRQDIRGCTSPRCPLFRYRAYK